MRYTGQREAEAGLYFYNARWFVPLLGWFAQADSIIPQSGNPVAWDRYAYIVDDPFNKPLTNTNLLNLFIRGMAIMRYNKCL